MGRRRGMTLMELLITVTIVGILASMALPSFDRAVDRGHWRDAQDVLRTVYAGEQVYFTTNDVFRALPAGSTLAEWREIYMDDPNTGVIPAAFTVATTIGPPPTFTAKAQHADGRCMTMDENNLFDFAPPIAGCAAWPMP